MMHTRRTWGASVVQAPEELAKNLIHHTWTGCAAFRTPGGTVWANDSTHEDALQEYGVLRPTPDGSWRQVESITVSWCSQEDLTRCIEDADRGAFDDDLILDQLVAGRIQELHERCRLCE
jgi:hypothetical protein